MTAFIICGRVMSLKQKLRASSSKGRGPGKLVGRVMLETALPPVFGKELKSVAFFDRTFLSEGAFFWLRLFSTFFSPVHFAGKPYSRKNKRGVLIRSIKLYTPPVKGFGFFLRAPPIQPGGDAYRHNSLRHSTLVKNDTQSKTEVNSDKKEKLEE